MKKLNLWKLILAVLICEGAGVVGSFVTFPVISSWYVSLNKPSFSPPNFLFGPVWTILYFLMGISLYLVWNKGGKYLKFFWAQLFLNVLWSFLFFGLHSPILGLIDILALWVVIFLTIKTFMKIQQTAGILLLPYLAWVSFAAVLNFSIWRLN